MLIENERLGPIRDCGNSHHATISLNLMTDFWVGGSAIDSNPQVPQSFALEIPNSLSFAIEYSKFYARQPRPRAESFDTTQSPHLICQRIGHKKKIGLSRTGMPAGPTLSAHDNNVVLTMLDTLRF